MKRPLAAICIMLSLCQPALSQEAVAQQGTTDEQIASVRAELNAAGARIRAFINQPVTRLPYSPGNIGKFGPGGWFHPGAQTPDFEHVDIRTTQEFPYDKFTYVTSDVNPGEMFIASELEFNAMTKYFYTDRSLPKHRLSEEQMVEVNRLYRIYGADLRKLDALQHPDLFTALTSAAWLNSPYVTLAALVLLGGAMGVMWRSWFARR